MRKVPSSWCAQGAILAEAKKHAATYIAAIANTKMCHCSFFPAHPQLLIIAVLLFSQIFPQICLYKLFPDLVLIKMSLVTLYSLKNHDFD